MTTTELDQAEAEAFAGRMVTVINDAALALSLSIGHRTGLFDTLAGLAPSTSEEIAGASGCNERYVREWLGAMVAGHVVDYDAATRTYVLPAEHAASLTRAAGAGNIASIAQDGSDARRRRGTDRRVLPSRWRGSVLGIPDVPHDRRRALRATTSTPPCWRARCRSSPDSSDGSKPASTSPTSGAAPATPLCVMARAFPNSRFQGFDFSEEAITAARDTGARLGARQRHLRGSRRDRPVADRGVRLHHHVRRGPRPSGTRPGPGRHRRCAPSRRRVPLRGCRRARATSRTTPTTRSGPSSTRSPRCTA